MFSFTKSNDTQALRNLIPLTTLSAERFEKLCSAVRVETASNGTILFREGDSENQFVYLLSGKVSLQAGDIEMDFIEGGSDASRFALAHQIPRKVNAVAKSKVRFVRIDAELLNKPKEEKQQQTSSYEVSDMPEESSKDWMTILVKSPIFQRLPASNLQQVMMDLEEIEVSEGQQVIRQEQPGDYYYIIKTGKCVVTRKSNPQAKEITLAKLSTSDTFGEDALISGKPRNVNITMLTPGSLLRLPKEKFVSLIKDPIIHYTDYPSIQKELELGHILIDVRPADNYKIFSLENSKNVPFFSLRMQMSCFDTDHKPILICDDGKTSEAAAFFLIGQGLDAVVLKGGLNSIPKDQLQSLKSKSQSASPSKKSPENQPNSTQNPGDKAKTQPLKDTGVHTQIKQTNNRLEMESAREKNNSKTLEQSTAAVGLGQSKPEEKSKQLQTALDSKTEALAKETAANQELNTKLKNLQADSDKEKMAAENRLEESKFQLSESEQRIKSLQNDLNQITSTKDYLTQDVQELKQKLEQLTAERSEIEQKTTAQQSADSAKFTELQDQLKRTEEQAATQQSTDSGKIAELQASISSLEQAVAEKDKRYENDHSSVSEKITQLEQERTELMKQNSESVSRLEGEVAELRHQLTRAEEQVATQQSTDSGKIVELQTSIDSLKQTLTEKELKFQTDQLTSSEKIRQLEQERSELVKQHSESVSGLEAEITELKNQLTEKNQLETRLQEVEQASRSQQEEFGSQISSLQSEKDTLQSELMEKSGIVSELESKLGELEKENSDSQSRLERLREDSQKNSQAVEGLEQLQQQLRQFEEQKTVLESEKKEAQDRAESLTQQNEELKSVVQNFVDQNQGNEETSSLNAELETIRNQAKSDFEVMMAQLNEAKNQSLELKLALEKEKQRNTQLESEINQPLAIGGDLTPTDDDIFFPEKEEKEENNDELLALNDSNGEEKTKSRISVFPVLLAVLYSVIFAVASAGAFLLGTEQGTEILAKHLNVGTTQHNTTPIDSARSIAQETQRLPNVGNKVVADSREILGTAEISDDLFD